MPTFSTRRTAAFLAVAAGLVAAAPALASPASAPASAATVTTNRICYHENGHMRITGSGLYPGSKVEIAPEQNVFGGVASKTVGPDGTFSALTSVPSADDADGPAVQRLTLTVHVFPPIEPGSTLPEITRQLPVDTATPGVSATAPRHARGARARQRRFSFAYFRPGHEIYGYYLRNWHHQNARDSVARVAFGRASGPCGVLHTTAPLIPSGTVTRLAQRDFWLGVTFSTRPRYTPGEGILFFLDSHGTKLDGGGFGPVTTNPSVGPAVALPGWR